MLGAQALNIQDVESFLKSDGRLVTYVDLEFGDDRLKRVVIGQWQISLDGISDGALFDAALFVVVAAFSHYSGGVECYPPSIVLSSGGLGI
ncbi:hypothetical protein Tco_1395241, partial [Tanacetum coccineum]